jgi:hypothetical protein
MLGTSFEDPVKTLLLSPMKAVLKVGAKGTAFVLLFSCMQENCAVASRSIPDFLPDHLPPYLNSNIQDE